MVGGQKGSSLTIGRLKLTPDQQRAIAAHGEATYPEECCGALLGVILPLGDRLVHQVCPLENRWSPAIAQEMATQPGEDCLAWTTGDRRSRFWIDPQDLMTLQSYGRDRGWILLGIYHSHPDDPAHPSLRDRAWAWEGYSYPIVAIHQGHTQALTSWRWQETGPDQGDFYPEPIDPAPVYHRA